MTPADFLFHLHSARYNGKVEKLNEERSARDLFGPRTRASGGKQLGVSREAASADSKVQGLCARVNFPHWRAFEGCVLAGLSCSVFLLWNPRCAPRGKISFAAPCLEKKALRKSRSLRSAL